MPSPFAGMDPLVEERGDPWLKQLVTVHVLLAGGIAFLDGRLRVAFLVLFCLFSLVWTAILAVRLTRLVFRKKHNSSTLS
jgi:hypothetical protein